MITKNKKPPTISQLRDASALISYALIVESSRVKERYGNDDRDESAELDIMADDILRIPSRIETSRARMT
jgi:hypothetical protein